MKDVGPHLFVSINNSRTCVRCGEDLQDPVHKDPPQADVDEVMRAPGVTVRTLGDALADPFPRPGHEDDHKRIAAEMFEPDGYYPQKVTVAELGRKAGATVHLLRTARELRDEVDQDAFYYYGPGRDRRPAPAAEDRCPACLSNPPEAEFCSRCGRLLGLEPMRPLEAAAGVVVGEAKPDRGLRGQASERTQEVLASFHRPDPGKFWNPSPEWRQYLAGVTVVVAATNQDAVRAVMTLGRKNPGTPYMPRAFDALAYGSRVKAVVFVDGWDQGLPPEVAKQHRQGWLSRVAP